MDSDTIAAIATPLGQGGIGVVRISGPQSLQILQNICKLSKKPLSRKAYHGWAHVKNVSRETFLADEVVYTYFKAPKSYTGEDVLEISCHGGIAVLRSILDEVIRHGARLADRGEFTKRAFLNQKLDLAQAEAVLDLIKAKTPLFARNAASQLKGHLSKKIDLLYEEVLSLSSLLEANIDFPDDINCPSPISLLARVDKILKSINQYLATAELGQIMREGVKTAIIGAPNVGKSTLLNTLLGQERAIVTHVPGTTRDVIEEQVNLGDVVLNVSDTAGLREAKCLIEKAGIARSRAEVDRAGLILFVVDASKPLSKGELDLLGRLSEKKVLIVFNKIDLINKAEAERQKGGKAKVRLRMKGIKYPIVETCLLQGRGVEKLKKLIIKTLVKNNDLPEADAILLTSRHKECLERAKGQLLNVIKSIKMRMPPDCSTIDLRGAAKSLGEVTGKTVTEEIIDKIFGEFCVGK